MNFLTLLPTNSDVAIVQVMNKFVAGDISLIEHIAENIDFRIDHFADHDTDTQWQVASNLEQFVSVLTRLSSDVFPKGTTARKVDTYALGNDWYLTQFKQAFFYGVTQKDVTSETYIVSHQTDGKMDYFRETVTNIVEA